MPSIPASFHAKSEFPVCSKAVPDLGFREKRHRSVWEVKGEGNDLENCVLARIHAIRFICQLVRRRWSPPRSSLEHESGQEQYLD